MAKTHGVLCSALNQAVRLGVIGLNPADRVQKPREPEREMSILDESGVSRFCVAIIGHRWEALFNPTLATGAREMELLGLDWTDLDWVRQSLKIERQLVRPEGVEVQFSSPKTRFGRRTIVLGLKTIENLRKHYDRQLVERQEGVENWREYGLMFTTSVGTPIHPRNLLRTFEKILEGAGLPAIRFHDLRHTAASLMLNSNIPAIAVSRRLGHAKASITLDIYGHLIPTMRADAAEIIDGLLTPIPVEPQVLAVGQKVS